LSCHSPQRFPIEIMSLNGERLAQGLKPDGSTGWRGAVHLVFMGSFVYCNCDKLEQLAGAVPFIRWLERDI